MRVADETISAIINAVDAAKELPRTRETSIAITHLETALLWIEKAEASSED